MDQLGLTIESARRVLGGNDAPISRSTIFRMIAKQQVEAFKVGRRTLVTRESLQRYVEGCPRIGGNA